MAQPLEKQTLVLHNRGASLWQSKVTAQLLWKLKGYNKHMRQVEKVAIERSFRDPVAT
jgi:hypothetical protein